ncbi:metallophosphoesterase [Tissierella sp.]|uniref:metallophosphoesterase family protein n=1 Tax=Tissierella sp. TaxID=41274 RepID=UPI0028A698FB|nr:metallophosphoesterase [Tissierella sp.]
MELKIFHTGDIHLGMKFNNYADEIRENLCEARFLALENMIIKSNELNTDLFVIAGDLFNTIQVSKKDINRTVKILDKFNGGCVLVLPGNHDYDNGMIDLWREFTKIPSEKIVLLNEKKHYFLNNYDLDVVIYPAPCHNKHSSENGLGWIKEEGLAQTGKYHIGVAHGALEGLSPDIEGNYYYMGINELSFIPTNLWLLGHTHLMYPFKDKILDNKIFNAGTPEPDGLDYKDEGNAWFITINDEKIVGDKIPTGKYRFFDQEFELNSDEDLNSIESWALKDDPNKKIIRLCLKGSISNEAYENLNAFYRNLESNLFHLMVDDSNLRVKINKTTIEREFTKGSFPYEFLNSLTYDDEALQIAYDLLRRG